MDIIPCSKPFAWCDSSHVRQHTKQHFCAVIPIVTFTRGSRLIRTTHQQLYRSRLFSVFWGGSEWPNEYSRNPEPFAPTPAGSALRGELRKWCCASARILRPHGIVFGVSTEPQCRKSVWPFHVPLPLEWGGSLPRNLGLQNLKWFFTLFDLSPTEKEPRALF